MRKAQRLRLIDDKAIFDLHSIAASELVEVSDANTPLPDAMTQLAGRHQFWMHPTELARKFNAEENGEEVVDDRLYTTIRIDPDNRMISGDLFEDIGRRRWIASWVSEAVFGAPIDPLKGWSEDWDLFSIADVHWDKKSFGSEAKFAKVAMALKNEDGRILGCRIIGIKGAESRISDLSFTDPNYSRQNRFSSYRRMRLVNVFHAQTEDDIPYVDIARDAISNGHRNLLLDALRKSGAGIFWDTADEESFEVADVVVDRNKRELELLSQRQFTGDPYRYIILMTSIIHEKRVLGIVPGLDGERPSHKPRFGAIVHIKEIVNRYLQRYESQTGKPAEDYILAGKVNPEYDQVTKVIKDRIVMFYIHELGHLMNLPHPWQRDAFSTPALPTRPFAKSVMNYGSLYPLGEFMQVSRVRKIDEISTDYDTELQNLIQVDADNSLSKDLSEIKFTPEESRWIRHAPFDYFVPNNRYFTEDFLAQPQIQTSPDGRYLDGYYKPYLELEIWDGMADRCKDTLLLRHTEDKDGPRQPVFGTVKFKLPNRYEHTHKAYFTFQAPSLSLLVRAESPTRSFPDEHRFVQAPALPYDENAAIVEGLILQSSLREREGEFKQTIPLLDDAFFATFANAERNVRFTLQAILHIWPRRDAKRVEIFHSNSVEIAFVPHRDPMPQPLQDEMLGMLAAATTLDVGGVSIEELQFPKLHCFAETEARLRPLVASFEDLPSGTEPAALTAYLTEKISDIRRANAISALDHGNKLSIDLEAFLEELRIEPERLDFLERFFGATTRGSSMFDTLERRIGPKGVNL